MGAKIDSYTDRQGNIVRDGDIVIYEGKEYRVIYISYAYVNLEGNGGLHLPFSVGTPKRKAPNYPNPVATETIVRKRIVPGVYGKVVVERESNGDFHFDARNLLLSDLPAAIATLTKIQEAMSDPSFNSSPKG